MLPAQTFELPVTRLGWLATIWPRRLSGVRREKRDSREVGLRSGLKPHGEQSPDLEGRKGDVVGEDMRSKV